MSSKRWSEKDIEKALKILSENTNLYVAINKLQIELNRQVTQDSLRNALRRNGKSGGLEKYLRKTRVEENKDFYLELLLKILKKVGTHSFQEICNSLDLSPSKTEEVISKAKASGFRVEFADSKISLERKPDVQAVVPEVEIKRVVPKEIKLGIISDTHIGAFASMEKEIQHFVNTAYNEHGVTTLLHIGDCLAGTSVYRGQPAELRVWGSKAQCERFAEVLPQHKGLSYIGILGNHDISFMKENGVDVGDIIESMREDFMFIGHLRGQFKIEGCGLTVEMGHIKTAAHARSYSLEKHIYNTVSNTDRFDVVFMGHRHTQGYFEVQGIHAFLVPCFENENLFCKYNGFRPSVGGLIATFKLDDSNKIVSCIPEFVHYESCAVESFYIPV